MRVNRTAAGLLVLLALALSQSALAYRCGTRVINAGDSKPLVQDKCGKPEHVETIREGHRSDDYIREERWYYPKRTGKLRPVVVFNSDGRVSEIRMEQ